MQERAVGPRKAGAARPLRLGKQWWCGLRLGHALYAAGQHALAEVFAAVVVVDQILLYPLGQAAGSAMRRNSWRSKTRPRGGL